jgi:hypothetical protein
MKQLTELQKVQNFLLIGMSLHGVPKDQAIGIMMFIDNYIKKMEELISFMQETERTPQEIISKAAVLL